MLSRSFEEMVLSSSRFFNAERLTDSKVPETFEDFNFTFFLRPSITKIGNF